MGIHRLKRLEIYMLRLLNKLYKRVSLSNIMVSNSFIRICNLFNPVDTLLASWYFLGMVNNKINCIHSEPYDGVNPVSNVSSGSVGTSGLACRLDHMHPSDRTKVDSYNATITNMIADIGYNIAYAKFSKSGTYSFDAEIGTLLLIRITEDDTTVNIRLPISSEAVEGSFVKIARTSVTTKTDDDAREINVGIDLGWSTTSFSVDYSDVFRFMRVRINNELQWVYL